MTTIGLLLVFLSSCSEQANEGGQQSVVSPSPNSAAVSTSETTIAPTQFLSPLSSPQPTQVPTLSPNEPLLIFAHTNSYWALSSSDLSKTKIELPQGGCVRSRPNAIAPHGHWMVLYMNCSDEEISPEMSLALFHIPDGKLRPITRLFVEAKSANPAEFGNDIFVFDWSPDGRYLAFAGAIDRPYLDLYLYDMVKDDVRRLTDNLQEIEYVEWSPDGKWIWFENSKPEGAYERRYFYALQPAILEIQTPTAILNDRWNINEGWVSSNEYFLVNASEGCCGENYLRYINVESGQETVLWETDTIGYAIDSEELFIAVSAAPEADLQGSYIIDWSGNRKKISDEVWRLAFRGGVNSRYIGFDGEEAVSIAQDGSIKQVSDKPFYSLSVSPDRTWFVLYDEFNNTSGIDLYSESDQFVKTITDAAAFPVAWQPDSTGLFYMASNLYYIGLPDGEPILIEECGGEKCRFWVAGKEDFIWAYP
jgi:WD40 repeat protein